MFLCINDLSSKLINIFRDLEEKDVSVNGTLFEYYDCSYLKKKNKNMLN